MLVLLTNNFQGGCYYQLGWIQFMRDRDTFMLSFLLSFCLRFLFFCGFPVPVTAMATELHPLSYFRIFCSRLQLDVTTYIFRCNAPITRGF